MAPAPPSTYFPLVLIALIAWGFYRRVRRNIGRQRLQPRRMVVRMVLIALITAMFGVFSLLHTQVMLGFIGGLLLSLPLAYIGLHLTRFEATPEGRFYTPNTYIGVALSGLLIIRVVMQMFRLYSVSPTTGLTYSTLPQSALTYFLFGLRMGYYMAYYAGVFYRSRRVEKGLRVDPESIRG
jgi:hypothetical protein